MKLTSGIAGGSKCGIAADNCPFLRIGLYTAIGVTPLRDGTTNEYGPCDPHPGTETMVLTSAGLAVIPAGKVYA